MRQTTLSVALEVKPESADHLSGLLDRLRDRRNPDPSGGTGPFAEFLTLVPAVHFMSLSVFPGYDYDPLFVVEANFDGEAGPFWAQLEAAIGSDLRAFLRCCKRPLDNDGPLFDAITAPDSRAPIAPYMERRAHPHGVSPRQSRDDARQDPQRTCAVSRHPRRTGGYHKRPRALSSAQRGRDP